MQTKRLMSGMRSTGKLHLGHYFGVLQNWIQLQDEYDCFFEIADWHALTTKYDDTSQIKENVIEVAKDWLSCGINPNKAKVYIQSDIPEIAELHLLLSMVTPQNWVERSATLKDMVKMLRGNDETDTKSEKIPYGLLGYPILQTADIIIFNASIVPIGQDQLAHLELSRDIVRRFNHLYNTETFIEPKPKLTEVPLLVGLDGNKMGKSNNNDIKIGETSEETTKKIMSAITDPARTKKDIPGTTSECRGIYPLYKVMASKDIQNTVKEECESANRGCVQCKRQLAEIVNKHFEDTRAKRKEFDNCPEKLREILNDGKDKARKIASITLTEAKKAMKIYY